jgi:hypothetical protein
MEAATTGMEATMGADLMVVTIDERFGNREPVATGARRTRSKTSCKGTIASA